MVAVDATLEAVSRRDRVVVITTLFAVIALSWAYLPAGAGMGMSAFQMTRRSHLGRAGGMSAAGMASYVKFDDPKERWRNAFSHR